MPRKKKKSKKGKEYEVEQIIAVRISEEDQDIEFRVKWKGYPMEDCTWVPEENVNCPDLIQAFFTSNLKIKDVYKSDTNEVFALLEWQSNVSQLVPLDAVKYKYRNAVIDFYTRRIHWFDKKSESSSAENSVKEKEAQDPEKEHKIVNKKIEDGKVIYCLKLKDCGAVKDCGDEKDYACEKEHKIEKIVDKKIQDGKVMYCLKLKSCAAENDCAREGEHEIEKIVSKNIKDGNAKGCAADSENIWEAAENLNCPELIVYFEYMKLESVKRGCTPDKIESCVKNEYGEILVKMKWLLQPKPEFILFEVAKRYFPVKLLEFLETKVKWDES